MEDAKALKEMFQVRERFRRSVNISADYQDVGNLDGYVITSLTATLLSRIGRGLRGDSTGRAWSITGPYGAGKSAAALFLAEILRYPMNRQARNLLSSESPELMESLYSEIPGLCDGGYLVVPVVGSREPIYRSLLVGLLKSVSNPDISSVALDDHLNDLRNLYEEAKAGSKSVSNAVAQAIADTATIACASENRVLGLLIIYDELGRALEHVALHPERSDIGILQTIAEMASRSEEAPFGLVTILHQSFEYYAAGLSPTRKREWAKIQGRFEDIGFLQSPGELLTLVGKAIKPVQSVSEKLEQLIRGEVEKGKQIGILPQELEPQEAFSTLCCCAPLHPTTALLLARVFRSPISQNERSLFAFLSSREPFGFQEYLERKTWGNNAHRPFYRIHNFYDYIKAAMGSMLYTQSRGRQWAEIEEALDRLPRQAGETEARLVKTIGLLGLFGDQRYLKASVDVLVYSLADDHEVHASDVHQALDTLREWDIVVYRRFKEAFSLWQGSDIDLNKRFEEGVAHIDRSQSLPQLLQERGQIKPYVAKRHLHQTGTFRYFAPWVTAMEDLKKVGDRPFGEADGAVVFVLGTSGEPIEKVESEVIHFARQLKAPRREQLLFAIPREAEGLHEAFEEILTWEWVAENTPGLEGDGIARRELAARRLAAQERLDRASARSFETFSAYRSCVWIWRGEKQELSSARDLSSLFSHICDHVYFAAPIVDNELINRRDISSAVVAARRSLIEQMLTQADESRLGIEGYPPEVSVYLSVLESSGLHHQEGDSRAFGPLAEADPCHIKPMWQAIDGFLTRTEKEPLPVEALYKILKAPPFGIREGLLPIYFIAAVLHWESEIALYEKGSFIPKLGAAEGERLMKLPETFSVQRYGLDETRQHMLYEYSTLFEDGLDPGDASQLTAVRPIIAFANQLPRYTQMTQSLSDEAIAVREALLSAREPQRLLLEGLPQALSFEVPERGSEGIQDYFSHLKQILVELQSAYEQLLFRIQEQLLDIFLLPSDLETARLEIGSRAQLLEDWIAELELKAFVSRLADTELALREWLESVAACLVHKPPSKWNDEDVLAYEVALTEMAQRFRRTEEVALERGDIDGDTLGGRAVRLSVTDSMGREQREIVRITSSGKAEVEEAVDVLRGALQGLQSDRKIQVMAVAELVKEVLGKTSSSQQKNGKQTPS